MSKRLFLSFSFLIFYQAYQLQASMEQEILDSCCIENKFRHFDSEDTVWIGQQQALLLTPDDSKDNILTTGSFPCSTITIFNKNNPGYVCLMHIDSSFISKGFESLLSQMSIIEKAGMQDDFEIKIFSHYAEKHQLVFCDFYGRTQIDYLEKLKLSIENDILSTKWNNMISINIFYSRIISESDPRYTTFFSLLSSFAPFPLDMDGEKRILEIDLPRSFGINKITGEVFQTSFRVTRFLRPINEDIINRIGRFRHCYNNFILPRSFIDSYNLNEILISVDDNVI